MTETDVKRKENFLEELRDIAKYLDLLQDMKSLPDEFFSTDDIQSKAFELMTATLELIMHQVKYITSPLGGFEIKFFRLITLGRMVKQLLTKNQEEYESIKETLKTAVCEYDRALDHGHRKMDAETFLTTKSTNFFLV